MKSIIQSKPTIGPATPYKPGEDVRVFGTRTYWELEFPFPMDNRTSPPDAYLVFYVIPDGRTSITLANPGSGITEVIDTITQEKEYEHAFRQEWPLFNQLLVSSPQFNTEVTKRPVLVTMRDPDDGVTKWLVARQVSITSRPNNGLTEVELAAIDSLLLPTLKLVAEAQDAFTRVGTGLVYGKYPAPKTKIDKFYEGYKLAMDGLGFVKDVLEGAARK